MSFDRGTKWCFHVLLLSCMLVGCAWLCMVTVSLLAGSEPVARPVFHFDMDTDDATQTSARTDIHRGWSIQSGRVVNGCESIFLDNLSYGARMMYLTCQRTLFGSGNG